MATNRKLQTEIDRVLKKVSEGVVEFEEIREKVYSANNSSQREKHETELKKSIKKLQRLRDQIKTWLTSNDIKDKRTLLDARKLVETQMERYRATEKDSKNKKHTREGAVIRPEDKRKVESRNWIQKSIDETQLQTEQIESEILKAKQKKGKAKENELKKLVPFLERHMYHSKVLEIILRRLENETLSVEEVDEVRDSVEDYLENYRDPDFFEDDAMYDSLDIDLDPESASATSTFSLSEEPLEDSPPQTKAKQTKPPQPTPTPTPAPQTTTKQPTVAQNKKKGGQQQSVQPQTQTQTQQQQQQRKGATTTNPTPSSQVQPGMGQPQAPTAAAVVRANKQQALSKSGGNLPSSQQAHPTISAPPGIMTKQTPQNQSLPRKSSKPDPVSSLHSSPFPPLPSQTGLLQTPSMPPSSHHPQGPSGPNIGASQRGGQSMAQRGGQSMRAAAAGGDKSGGMGPGYNLHQQKPGSGGSSVATSTAQQKGAGGSGGGVPQYVTHGKGQNISGGSYGQQGQPGGQQMKGYQGQSGQGQQLGLHLSSSHPQMHQHPHHQHIQQHPSQHGQQQQQHQMQYGQKQQQTQPQQKGGMGVKQQQQQQQREEEWRRGREKGGAGDGKRRERRSTLSKQERLFAPRNKKVVDKPKKTQGEDILRLLSERSQESVNCGSTEVMSDDVAKEMVRRSFTTLPKFFEPEKSQPKNPCVTPSYYPQEANGIFDDPAVFRKVELDLLFFIFFYRHGTYQQYLAANQLKSQLWRFHTHHQTWFKRHEKTKAFPDYETGIYLFFDYPSWGFKKKDFRFDYRYLEKNE